MKGTISARERHQPYLKFQGLSSTEIETRRQQYGNNVLKLPEQDPWWTLWLEKFDDPAIRILTIAAAIALGVGICNHEYIEALGIIVAILLATTIAFLNEYQANREFNILNQADDDVPVNVIRDGTYTTVAKKEIVVGDIVLVEMGEEIPADGEILEAVSLQVNEANLTGEPSVEKVAKDSPNFESDPDRAYPIDRLFRGSFVVDGHGTLVVTAVGDRTEIGQTARAATQDTEEDTPLNRQLQGLSQLIGVVGLLVAVAIDLALVMQGVLTGELALTAKQWYFTGLVALSASVAFVQVWLPIINDGLELVGREIRLPWGLEGDRWRGWLVTFAAGGAIFAGGTVAGLGFGWLPASVGDWLPADAAATLLTYFTIAVTIIVVAVPEGLALSVTLSLAYSMRKMTADNNLVRRMHACETVGAATVICSDKTGTITLNQMRLHHAELPDLHSEAGARAIEAICVNSTANLHYAPDEDEAVRPLGNPTEGALLLWLDECGIDYIDRRNDFPVARQWTFSTERKYMATLGVSPLTGRNVLHLKGAPELLLSCCSQQLTADGVQPLSNPQAIEAQLAHYQSRGMRVLGFAYLDDAHYREGIAIDASLDRMTWLGFVAIADPIRSDVPEAIAACRQAGIDVKMITGDNLKTAKEIARQVGLIDDRDPDDCYMTGVQFGQLDDKAATAAAKQLKVLARARPIDKQHLVKLLQHQGEVVAMTGDGTNDAPALNQAQVGLAMGQNSSCAAKEASDIILLDSSFKSIELGIIWGRSLYQNIQKFILFQLTINVAACGLALLGPFIGVDLPFTVTQLLWVNLIMDTFAALALATEPPDEDVMRDPPRDPQALIISSPMARQIVTVAPVFLVGLTGFLLAIQQDGIVSDRELSLFFTTFVLLQFWNLFNAKCFGLNHSIVGHLANNKSFLAIALAILLGQVLIVQFGGGVFRTVPLSWQEWIAIIGGTSVVLIAGEIWRFVARRTTRGTG